MTSPCRPWDDQAGAPVPPSVVPTLTPVADYTTLRDQVSQSARSENVTCSRNITTAVHRRRCDTGTLRHTRNDLEQDEDDQPMLHQPPQHEHHHQRDGIVPGGEQQGPVLVEALELRLTAAVFDWHAFVSQACGRCLCGCPRGDVLHVASPTTLSSASSTTRGGQRAPTHDAACLVFPPDDLPVSAGNTLRRLATVFLFIGTCTFDRQWIPLHGLWSEESLAAECKRRLLAQCGSSAGPGILRYVRSEEDLQSTHCEPHSQNVYSAGKDRSASVGSTVVGNDVDEIEDEFGSAFELDPRVVAAAWRVGDTVTDAAHQPQEAACDGSRQQQASVVEAHASCTSNDNGSGSTHAGKMKEIVEFAWSDFKAQLQAMRLRIAEIVLPGVHVQSIPAITAVAFPALRAMDLHNNIVQDVAQSVMRLPLECLQLRVNNIGGGLCGSPACRAGSCRGLWNMPREVAPFGRLYTTLRELDLTGNHLSRIPDAVANLHALETLIVDNNNVRYVNGLDMHRLARLRRVSIESNPVVGVTFNFVAAMISRGVVFSMDQRWQVAFGHNGAVGCGSGVDGHCDAIRKKGDLVALRQPSEGGQVQDECVRLRSLAIGKRLKGERHVPVEGIVGRYAVLDAWPRSRTPDGAGGDFIKRDGKSDAAMIGNCAGHGNGCLSGVETCETRELRESSGSSGSSSISSSGSSSSKIKNSGSGRFRRSPSCRDSASPASWAAPSQSISKRFIDDLLKDVDVSKFSDVDFVEYVSTTNEFEQAVLGLEGRKRSCTCRAGQLGVRASRTSSRQHASGTGCVPGGAVHLRQTTSAQPRESIMRQFWTMVGAHDRGSHGNGVETDRAAKVEDEVLHGEKPKGHVTCENRRVGEGAVSESVALLGEQHVTGTSLTYVDHDTKNVIPVLRGSCRPLGRHHSAYAAVGTVRGPRLPTAWDQEVRGGDAGFQCQTGEGGVSGVRRTESGLRQAMNRGPYGFTQFPAVDGQGACSSLDWPAHFDVDDVPIGRLEKVLDAGNALIGEESDDGALKNDDVIETTELDLTTDTFLDPFGGEGIDNGDHRLRSGAHECGGNDTCVTVDPSLCLESQASIDLGQELVQQIDSQQREPLLQLAGNEQCVAEGHVHGDAERDVDVYAGLPHAPSFEDLMRDYHEGATSWNNVCTSCHIEGVRCSICSGAAEPLTAEMLSTTPNATRGASFAARQRRRQRWTLQSHASSPDEMEAPTFFFRVAVRVPAVRGEFDHVDPEEDAASSLSGSSATAHTASPPWGAKRPHAEGAGNQSVTSHASWHERHPLAQPSNTGAGGSQIMYGDLGRKTNGATHLIPIIFRICTTCAEHIPESVPASR